MIVEEQRKEGNMLLWVTNNLPADDSQTACYYGALFLSGSLLQKLPIP